MNLNNNSSLNTNSRGSAGGIVIDNSNNCYEKVLLIKKNNTIGSG